jgi:hypothetical protein
VRAAAAEALRGFRASGTKRRALDAVWVPLDATGCAGVYAGRAKPFPPTAAAPPDLAPFRLASPPSLALVADRGSSKLAALKLQLTLACVDAPATAASASRSGGARPFSRVFAGLDAGWRRRDVPAATHAQGPLFPPLSARLAHTPELRSALVGHAATHLAQAGALQQVADRLALVRVSVSVGSTALCVWSRADSVFEARLSEVSVAGDTRCSDLSAMRLSTDKPVHLELAHYMTLPNQASKALGEARWGRVAALELACDARLSFVRARSDVLEQQRFLAVHDEARDARRAAARDALYGLAPLDAAAGLEEVFDPVPLRTKLPARAQAPAQSGHRQGSSSQSSLLLLHVPLSPLDRLASVAEVVDGDTDSSSSYSEGGGGADKAWPHHGGGRHDDDNEDNNNNNDDGASASSASFESAEEGEAEDTAADVVYVASRSAGLPMLGSADPYNAGIASLAPFLDTVVLDRVVESNDYWYGAAFDWIKTGYAPGRGATGEGTAGGLGGGRTRVWCVTAH